MSNWPNRYGAGPGAVGSAGCSRKEHEGAGVGNDRSVHVQIMMQARLETWSHLTPIIQ